MLWEFLSSMLIFAGVSFGLAWPVAARMPFDPAEKITVTVALSLLGVFVLAWIIYLWLLPLPIFWTLPVLAAVGLALNRHSLATLWRDASAREIVVAQLIVSGWCVGWLALVLSYSGGIWVADWFGHFQRTCFFLNRWPREILFNGFDALTSRPPLANLVNGAFLEITRQNFAHYPIFSTLLASLSFLPAALFARRFGGARALAVLAVLFMLNPLFVQNATYPWTKLPAAFYTLAALYFFLRAHDAVAPRAAGVLFAVCLAAGLLTHYSVGPYAALLSIGWLALGRTRRWDGDWWRTTASAALAGALVLVLWFGWTLAVYGWHGTFLTNTAVTDQAPTAKAQLSVIALNLRDTVVPHFFRRVEFDLLAQSSLFGWWRDWFYQLYQVNLFFAFGSVAWAGIINATARAWRGNPMRPRLSWAAFVAATIVLGVAVHGARDTWGLAHICLQPLVLFGLAFLAAGRVRFGPVWRLALAAGAIADLLLGIVLHFGVQSCAIARWLVPNRSVTDVIAGYSSSAQMNYHAKLTGHWVFLGDVFASRVGLVVPLLGALLLLAVIRARRATGSLAT